jgi:hypothetical protein
MGYLANDAQKNFVSSVTANTIAPTFSGIASVTPKNDGSFTITWSAATGSPALPVEYRMYVALGSVSAGSLFVNSNWVSTTKQTVVTGNVFQLGDGLTYFTNGLVYTFGVRAVSSQNVSDTNTAILTSTAIASGNLALVFQNIISDLNQEISYLNSDLSDIKKNTDLIPAAI